MKKQKLITSPLSQIDDSLYFVDVGKISRVYVNEAEAKADGYGDCGEYRVYSQVPDPSPTCVRSEDAEKWIETLFGDPPSGLYCLRDEDGTPNLYADLDDALRCQPDLERSTVEYVVLCGEGFDIRDVSDYPDANLSTETELLLKEYDDKLAAEYASPKAKVRSAQARRAK